MSDDYFSVLKVDPGASLGECRAAYIALAKRWHPDTNEDPEAHNQFRRLSLAYATARRRTASTVARHPQSKRLAEVVRCSKCAKASPIARKAEYVGLISLLVWSWRWRVGGIFCVSCARQAAFKTSAVSLALGWWSIPGIALTLPLVVRNVLGGRQDKAINVEMACHNLVALQAAGDIENARLVAHYLTQQGASLPLSVMVIINSLAGNRETKRLVSGSPNASVNQREKPPRAFSSVSGCGIATPASDAS